MAEEEKVTPVAEEATSMAVYQSGLETKKQEGDLRPPHRFTDRKRYGYGKYGKRRRGGEI